MPKRGTIKTIMFLKVFEHIAYAIDIIGIFIILWGIILALISFFKLVFTRDREKKFFNLTRLLRCQLGTYILIALEFMIAADVIHTILKPGRDELIFLAGIVLIRTAIGYFLGKEIESA